MNGNQITAYSTQEVQARERMAELFTGFVECVDRTKKTATTYLINLKQFAAWLNYTGQNVLQLQRGDIIQYRDWLQSEHDAIKLDADSPTGWSYRTNDKGQPLKVICKPSTVAQYMRVVKQLYKWLNDNHIYANIADGVNVPKVDSTHHKKDALTTGNVVTIEQSIQETAAERTQEAAQALKDAAGRMQRSDEQGKRLYAMFLLAVNAGLRTIEISRASIGDLETIGGQTWLYIHGKGHSEADQKKPLAAEVAAAIYEYIESRTDNPTEKSPLFVSTGNRSGGKSIAATTIGAMLKKAMKAAGINNKRITAHSLRHTAGTNVMEITRNNIFDAQMYMRHADPKTTEIYTHTNTEKRDAELAQNLYNHYHGKEVADSRERIEQIINGMSAEKLEQLAMIAKAIA